MKDDYINIIKVSLTFPTNLELYLLSKAKNGDQQAKEMIVKRHSRLVFSVAKTFYNNNHELKDLIGYGMIGLLKAIESYSFEKCKFSTYAFTCIRNSILENIGEETAWKKKATTIESIENVLSSEMQIAEYDFNELFKKHLTSKESNIIKLYFGLGANAENTLEIIGKKMGLSHERIRQIKNDALEKLKKALKDN